MRWEPRLWNYALFGLVFLILTNASVALYNAYKPFPKTFEEALIDSRYSHIDFTPYIKSGNSLILYRIKDGFQITDAVLQPPLGKINITSDEFLPLGDPVRVTELTTVPDGGFATVVRKFEDYPELPINGTLTTSIKVQVDVEFSEKYLELLGQVISSNPHFRLNETANFNLHEPPINLTFTNDSEQWRTYWVTRQILFRKIKCLVYWYKEDGEYDVVPVEVTCFRAGNASSAELIDFEELVVNEIFDEKENQ